MRTIVVGLVTCLAICLAGVAGAEEDLESLNTRAGELDQQGDYAAATQVAEQAVKVAERRFGKDAAETATVINNLAVLHDAQGQYAEAEPLHKRALAIREKVLGPDHPDTAQNLNNLALLYVSQGQYAEAEPLYKRALAIWEKVLGPDHPLTSRSLSNLVILQVALGRIPDAAAFSDRARRGTRRHVARVLPSLSVAEQALFLRTQDTGSFHSSLTLGLLQRSNPQIASLSAGWLANGKAVGQEAASQQVILARQSTNPATKAAVGSLERVRAELAKLAQMTPAPEQAAAYRARIASLQAEEQKLVREIGGQLAALDREEPWVEIDAAVVAYRAAIKAVEGGTFPRGRRRRRRSSRSRPRRSRRRCSSRSSRPSAPRRRSCSRPTGRCGSCRGRRCLWPTAPTRSRSWRFAR